MATYHLYWWYKNGDDATIHLTNEAIEIYADTAFKNVKTIEIAGEGSITGECGIIFADNEENCFMFCSNDPGISSFGWRLNELSEGRGFEILYGKGYRMRRG